MLPHAQHLCPINNAGSFLGVSAEMVGRCLGGWNETNALVLRMASLSPAVLGKAQLLLDLLSWETYFWWYHRSLTGNTLWCAETAFVEMPGSPFTAVVGSLVYFLIVTMSL